LPSVFVSFLIITREGYISKGSIFGTEVSHVCWWVV